MALILCAECSKQVSDMAEVCPNCGFPIKAKQEVDLKQIGEKSEAEQYHLQAQFIMAELQANLKVYNSNSAITGARPANIDLALQYIDRSLELCPDNPNYLNTKAILLLDGKGDNVAAATLLEKAHALNPRDINIQTNLTASKSPVHGALFQVTGSLIVIMIGIFLYFILR